MSLLDDIVPQVLADVVPPLTGQAVTLRRTVPGTYDPVLGTEGTATTTDYSITSLAPISEYDVSVADGSVIQIGDAFLDIAAHGLAVNPSTDVSQYTVIDGSITWDVVRATPSLTGASTASYRLHLRR